MIPHPVKHRVVSLTSVNATRPAIRTLQDNVGKEEVLGRSGRERLGELLRDLERRVGEVSELQCRRVSDQIGRKAGWVRIWKETYECPVGRRDVPNKDDGDEQEQKVPAIRKDVSKVNDS